MNNCCVASLVCPKVLEAQPVDKDKRNQDWNHDRNQQHKVAVLCNRVKPPNTRRWKQFGQDGAVNIHKRNHHKKQNVQTNAPHHKKE